MPRTKLSGVTLIELIIALIVVGILLSAALPMFSNISQNTRISATASNLYYALYYARNEALQRNANVYVSFNTGDNWCYGINTGSACNCTVPSSCNLGTASAAATGQLSLSLAGVTGNSLYFGGPHGQTSVAGQSITYTLYGQSPLIKITVGRMGNMQICSTGVSGYTAC